MLFIDFEIYIEAKQEEKKITLYTVLYVKQS